MARPTTSVSFACNQPLANSAGFSRSRISPRIRLTMAPKVMIANRRRSMMTKRSRLTVSRASLW